MTTINAIPIFDGHNDTLLDLHTAKEEGGRSFFSQSKQGHIDLPRARAGNLGGGFFAMFTPTLKEETDDHDTEENEEDVDKDVTGALEEPMAQPIDQAYAQQYVMALAAQLFRLEAESKGQAKVVRTVDELTTCLKNGVLAMIFHIEGAEAIDPDNLDTLYVLYQAGLRSVGIVWSRPTAFGYGVPFEFPHSPDTGPGLTDAGRNLVKACNQLGVLIDLSHLNEKGFWDVADLSEATLVATHSNAYALCNSPRNLTDKQLDAVKESGGIVGVNFHRGFLREDGKHKEETSLSEIVRHTNYLVDRMGIDHVAFGSDFDGANMPQDLGDAAGLPKLMVALQDQGYGEAELQKIAYQNWIRVLGQTWKST